MGYACAGDGVFLFYAASSLRVLLNFSIENCLFVSFSMSSLLDLCKRALLFLRFIMYE